MSLLHPNPELFFSKNDPQDPRLGELSAFAILDTLKQPSVVLWGAPDSEGIRLNSGRTGAELGPDQIRRFLYRMTPPASRPFPGKLYDLGNFQQILTLGDRHRRQLELATEAHRKDHFCVSLGGGHDYGYPDAAGFLRSYPQHALVVNFDAHLDVRPFANIPHSGTPFRRLLEEFPSGFHFLEVGLQSQCNSPEHASWATNSGAHLLWAHNLPAPTDFPSWPERRPCWISLDIDVFSNSEAPGCSQSWPGGLSYTQVMTWIKFLFQNFDVKGIGIYEVSPPLDLDSRTSKLAAQILYESLCLSSKSVL